MRHYSFRTTESLSLIKKLQKVREKVYLVIITSEKLKNSSMNILKRVNYSWNIDLEIALGMVITTFVNFANNVTLMAFVGVLGLIQI